MWQGHEVTNDGLISQSVLLINPQHPSPYMAPASFLEPRLQEQCLVPESLLNDCPRECLSQQEETLGLWRSRCRTAPGLEVSSCCCLPRLQNARFYNPPSLCSSFCTDKTENGEVHQRKKVAVAGLPEGTAHSGPVQGNLGQPGVSSWRRIALLILAITIHNVPGEDWSWGCLPPAVGSRHCPHSCAAWNCRS